MEYIYIGGKHFARVDGNPNTPTETKTYFYHTDHLGSTVLVTDSEGQHVWSAEYTPFGTVTDTSGPPLAKAAKFTGKDLDEDTGLYYFNARWYDSEIGRFIREDPVRDGTNWYVYCRNNPLILIDPSGKTPWSANRLMKQYHDDIIEIAHKHNISPVLLASVVYNENVLRWVYHDLKDTVATYLSLTQGHDPSIGLCQIQVSNAILLDFGLNSKEFAKLSREEHRQIKDMTVAVLDSAYREYYIEKLKDPLTNLDYAARYLKFLGEARDYESPELWLSDYNRGLSIMV